MLNHLTHSITLDEIVSFLKKQLQFKETSQQILQQQIINRKAEELNLAVIPEEIQSQADEFRRKKRLEKAEDTLAWLADQMITPEEWETGIQEKILREKLAKALFNEKVKAFFNQNKLNFDQVVIYQIIVPYEQLAMEIFYQIEEEEMSFYQAAHLYNTDEKRQANCGYEGKLYRWSIRPEFASFVFAATPHTVIPPIQIDENYHILMVEAFIPAELTPELYQELLNKMFEEWLASELNHLLHHTENQSFINEQK